MCTTHSRVLTTHEITFMQSHSYGTPDPLGSPSQVVMCDASKRKNDNTTKRHEGSHRQLSGVPTVTLSALLVFLSHSMSLLGAVMQAGLKLLSKPQADEFGSPWPERASAADQRKGQKFGLVILGRRPP